MQQRLTADSPRLALDGVTRARYERVRTHYQTIQDTERTLEGKLADQGAYAARDIWAGLYGVEQVDPATDGAPLRKVLDWAQAEAAKLPEFRSLAQAARDSVVASSLAAEALVGELAKLDWPQGPKASGTYRLEKDGPGGRPDSVELELREEGYMHITTHGGRKTTNYVKAEGGTERHAKLTAQELQRAGWRLVEAPGAAAPPSDEALEAWADAITANRNAGVAIRAALGPALAEAEQRLAGAEQVLQLGYSLQEAEYMMQEPDEVATAMLATIENDARFRLFLRDVGRLADAMSQSSVRQMVRGAIMPYDVGTTRSFAQLMPAELALLSLPATRSLQTVRVVAGHALGWQMAEVGNKGKGPMHLALDCSGSMCAHIHQLRAYGCAAALHAGAQGRSVTVSTFNSEVRDLEVDVTTPEGRLAAMRAFYRIQAGGGTDFRPVVQRVRDLGHAEDVLLFSDGYGALDEEVAREVFSQRALHYLVLGSEGDAHPCLKELAGPRMRTVDDLTSEDAIALASHAGKSA